MCADMPEVPIFTSLLPLTSIRGDFKAQMVAARPTQIIGNTAGACAGVLADFFVCARLEKPVKVYALRTLATSKQNPEAEKLPACPSALFLLQKSICAWHTGAPHCSR